MAKCKDCFHWNACKKMLETYWGHCIPSDYEGGADRCEDFISTADVAPRAEVAMIVLKSPKFDVCECKRCGTVFQPEAGDDLYYKFDDLNPFVVMKVMVRCPTCKTAIEIVRKESRNESKST